MFLTFIASFNTLDLLSSQSNLIKFLSTEKLHVESLFLFNKDKFKVGSQKVSITPQKS
jgi:hypothetical protein